MQDTVSSLKSPTRIEELDGLRAISVLLVIVAHLVDAGRMPFLPAYLVPFFASLGPFGVEVFFGISGFIITRLHLEELHTTGRICLRTFYLRRFFRIIPAYWTYLFVILCLAAVGELSLDGGCFLRSLFFVSNVK